MAVEGDASRRVQGASEGAEGAAGAATAKDRAPSDTVLAAASPTPGTSPGAAAEGTDAKVLEFLRVLEDYRLKCEEEGQYREASRAHRQLETLKRQEQRRQEEAIRARQTAERQDVQVAHDIQYSDFSAAWDAYMDEYDRTAQAYIQQMTERHAAALLEFQRGLQDAATSRPPKWSRELLEWRRREHTLARQRKYAEALRVKRTADRLEEQERGGMQTRHAAAFARKESQLRQQQQAELYALLKRIDARRREHTKQRALDSKRLLQRNRNVQAVLESRQAVETSKLSSDIKRALRSATASPHPQPAREPVPPARRPPKKRHGRARGRGKRRAQRGAEKEQGAEAEQGAAFLTGAPDPDQGS